LRVQRRIIYPADVEPEVKEIGDSGASYLRLRFRKGSITTGTILNITPTITPDRKNVLLNITAELIDFLGWEPYVFDFGSTIDSITYLFPETEVSRIQTRVSVPSNRSKIKDQKILLVLVQPTIILREEAEAEAIAAMK
jgi:hypothetical protein